MYDMYAAIALSVGNKAKAHDKHGDMVVVERHYGRIQFSWLLHHIDQSGIGETRGFDGKLGELRDLVLDKHGVNPSACVWYPVEQPFSTKEQGHEK